MQDEATVRAYLNTLQVGERVVETSIGHAYHGITGTVYKNSDGYLCVSWDTVPVMGTSVTYGTRRMADAGLV